MRRLAAGLLLVVLLAGATVACGGADSAHVRVRIGRLDVRAELARTPDERASGLSGRGTLAHDQGMLFLFPAASQPGFWMKDMHFPLDFIWISPDGHVIDLTQDVPPPAPGAPDAELHLYRPAAPVVYVLEVNAGTVAQAGVEVGAAVVFDPALSTAAVR